jgi:flavin-binding protein dodecin
MMGDLVSTAADVLMPFLAAGGAAVGAGVADQAGSELYKSAIGVIKKIKDRLCGSSKADVETAIRDALADGSLTRRELQQLQVANTAAQNNASTTLVGSISAETSFVGNTNISELNIGRRD